MEKHINISPEAAKYLIGSDADITLANINAFEKAFKEAVSAEVDARIKGKTPTGTVQQHTDYAVSKEDFKKLSMFEQNKLYKSDPSTYGSYVD